MSNAVFKLVVQTLAQAVSDRAADRMVRAALEDMQLLPDEVSAQEMQRVLVGPLLARLAAVMPRARAQQELISLARHLQDRYPKAPTLFDLPGSPVPGAQTPVWPPTWQDDQPAAISALSAATDDFFAAAPVAAQTPTAVLLADPVTGAGRPSARRAAAHDVAPSAGGVMPDEHTPGEPSSPVITGTPDLAPSADAQTGDLAQTGSSSDDFAWDADDFEFDDPEEALRVEVAARSYDLSAPADQEALLGDLARQRGVQGVVLCDGQGQVVRARLSRSAQPLGSVIAATALVFKDRPWRVMCADLGEQTVCMRSLGGHYVALLASGQGNIGRLIAELGALREAL